MIQLYLKIKKENKNYDQNYTKIIPSTFFSFDIPLQLMYADVADIRFFARFEVDLKYCPLVVDLFTSKFYRYHMKKMLALKRKLERFFMDIEPKKKKYQTVMRVTNLQIFTNSQHLQIFIHT